MNLVKIAKKPLILIESLEGTEAGKFFRVRNIVAYAEKSFYKEIHEFENYYTSKDGIEEKAKTLLDLENGISHADVKTPVMERLLSKSKSFLWEYNLHLEDNENEDFLYVRSYSYFGSPSTYLWNEEHDKQVAELQAICDIKNKKGAV